ncbi:MAG: ectonucleotide pyrophosphatase/phosphodiesterase [Pseudomonadales bacterium]
MNRVLRLLLLVGALAALPAAVAAAVAAPASSVVVLSWDGVRHDYPDRAGLPNLERLASDGVRAGRLIPVYPSNTFPGHVSLATGTYPDTHGIVDNVFVDAERGLYRYSAEADWIEAEPLWIAAERQGVPAATYFWVGSESDWRGQGTRFRIAPFDGDRPESEKVDQILEWLALPPEERPRLIMSYWAGADGEGHDHGSESSGVMAQLEAQDLQLGRLLAGMDALDLWDRTTLILVSDHGMTDVSRYVDLSARLEAAGVPARVMGGAVANVYLDDPADLERALVAIAGLEPARAWAKRDVPAAWRLSHPRRSGDIVVTVEPPFTLSQPRGLAGHLGRLYFALGGEFGSHGYRPDHPDMAGVFLAMGRGVPEGLVIPEVHQVDVAATIARLLGIDPPRQSEGRPVRGIGEQLIGGGAPAPER